jgi:acetyl esterase/lipase
MKHTPKKPTSRLPFYRKKWLLVGLGTILGLAAVLVVLFRVSPWPGALVIRTVFNQSGGQTLAAMKAKLPAYPVRVLSDEAYRSDDKAARLDVYIPKSARPDRPLPLVIWTHGGAWLSGDKKDAGPYFSRLADQGFVVVSLNYSLAPDQTYPTPLRELNDAYRYIQANALRFNANPQKVLLAGDSAGAQLSSQMAAIITNPAYAREVGVTPNLRSTQLAGVLLFCGIYKMEGLVNPSPTLPKIVGWGDDVAVWAYTGTRDQHSPLIRQMSAYYHVTKDFPATFVTGGNGDPLTDAQSVPLANELTALGVTVTRLFYSARHTPSLPHEYQFTFNADGERAFVETVQFAEQRTK